MHWALVKVFEMASLISITRDEHGLSKIITKIEDGNTVMVDDVKFNDSQNEFIHLEITADKDEPYLSIKIDLPYENSVLDKSDIL